MGRTGHRQRSTQSQAFGPCAQRRLAPRSHRRFAPVGLTHHQVSNTSTAKPV
jgi:hypothetical protein